MTSDPTDRADENEWDADDYDGDHSFVYEYGEDVVDLLDPDPGERILDLGCGTGHLTDRIADRGADVVGVDSSAEMIETARSRYPDRTFVRADARTFDLDGPFDAAFSNAMLHWVDDADQDDVLEGVRRALRPGGRFVAELGGTGNVSSIVDAVTDELAARGYDVAHPWYFPSTGEYASRLERHGFEVRLARLFDRPTRLEGGDDGLASWLEMFGDSLFADLSTEETRAVIDAVEDRLASELYRDGAWIADYRRLRFVAVLPTDGDP